MYACVFVCGQQVRARAQESVSQCAFVANLYASWQSRTNLYIVLQYVIGFGDLYMLWHDIGPLCEPVVRIYAAECALALGALSRLTQVYVQLQNSSIRAV
jgi:hypothetical protein